MSFDKDATHLEKMMSPLVVSSIYTGCRPCELFAIIWDDIDFESKTVSILSSKTSRVRVIPAVEPVIAALNWWKQFPKSKNDAVFYSKLSKKSVFPVMRKIFYSFFIRAIDRHESPSVFRHTFGRNVVLSCAPANVAQYLLGYATLYMTTRYMRLANLIESNAIKVMTNFLNGSKLDLNKFGEIYLSQET